jgi:hypothetical protein
MLAELRHLYHHHEGCAREKGVVHTCLPLGSPTHKVPTCTQASVSPAVKGHIITAEPQSPLDWAAALGLNPKNH